MPHYRESGKLVSLLGQSVKEELREHFVVLERRLRLLPSAAFVGVLAKLHAAEDVLEEVAHVRPRLRRHLAQLLQRGVKELLLLWRNYEFLVLCQFTMHKSFQVSEVS